MKTKVNTELLYIQCQIMRWIDDEDMGKQLSYKLYDFLETLPAYTSYKTKEKIIKFACECVFYVEITAEGAKKLL